MKKARVLMLCAVLVLVGAITLAYDLPNFLRTDIPGDTMLASMIGLAGIFTSGILAVAALVSWRRARKEP